MSNVRLLNCYRAGRIKSFLGRMSCLELVADDHTLRIKKSVGFSFKNLQEEMDKQESSLRKFGSVTHQLLSECHPSITESLNRAQRDVNIRYSGWKELFSCTNVFKSHSEINLRGQRSKTCFNVYLIQTTSQKLFHVMTITMIAFFLEASKLCRNTNI